MAAEPAPAIPAQTQHNPTSSVVLLALHNRRHPDQVGQTLPWTVGTPRVAVGSSVSTLNYCLQGVGT